MPITDTRFIPGDRDSCCSRFENFSAWFCEAICVMCCATFEVGISDDKGAWGWGKKEDTPPLLPAQRSYPIISPGTDFSFTVSEYGRFIPIVFGSDKLTGNVFWASDFDTQYFSHNNQTFYYTTVSFALGICEGEIDAMLRMWVGDQLVIDNTLSVDENGFPIPTDEGFISGATVDLTDPEGPLANLTATKRRTKISVFTGSESQIPEGIIVAEEGYSNTPAYRGLCYVLFENFIISDSTIPNIEVEVAANTNALFPRLYGELPTPHTQFDQVLTRIVAYDPGYGTYMIAAEDSDGSGAVPFGRGFVTFDGNSLQKLDEYEVQQTFDLSTDDENVRSMGAFLLQSGKYLLVPRGFDNIHIFNPFTGQLEASWGPSGVLGDVNDNGLQNIFEGACTFLLNPSGRPPQDILFVPCFANSGIYGNDVLFALVTVDDDNNFSLLHKNGTLITKDEIRSVPVLIDDDFETEQPTFFDGSPTAGVHVFAIGSNTAEISSFHIYKITVRGTGSLSSPDASLMATLSLTEIAGVGTIHNLEHIFIDPADNCIVMLIDVNGSGKSDRIVKYSPFTNSVLWSSPCSIWANEYQYPANQQQIITTSKYAFMNSVGRVQTVDLTDGRVTTVIEAPGDQQLPTPYGNLFQPPFYNGLENSISYISNVDGRQLVKVFLERNDRVQVPVSDIVTTLLKRVGVNEYDIDVNDLSALSLRGYTIDSVTSLRGVFAELGQVFRFDVVESNGQIVYKTRGDASVVTIPSEHMADVDANGYLSENQDNDFGRTRKINLTYKDIEREYDRNVQSVFFPKYTNSSFDDDMAIDVNVPVVLDATTARKLAEILLYSKIVAEQTYEGSLMPRYSYLDPGDVITVPMEDGTIDLRLRQVERGSDRSLQVRATREDQDIYIDQVNLFGNIGRFNGSEFDPLTPRIDPYILQIPYRSDEEAAGNANTYLMFVTLLNHRVSTMPTQDMTLDIGGAAQLVLPTPVTFPTWGYTMNALPYRSGFYSTDYHNVLRVKMKSQSGAIIGSVTKDTLVTLGVTCNLAYVGGELVQFEEAIDEGNDVWAFYNLQRCRLGTEMASPFHSVGEKFILLGGPDGSLDEGSIVTTPVEKALGPRMAVQTTVNTNNPFQPSPVVFNLALNLRPWSVSSFKTEFDGDDVHLSWKRRLRYDGQYADDGLESYPFPESTEEYRLYIYEDQANFNFNDPATYLRSVTLTSPEFIYTDAMAIEDGIDIYNDTLYCIVAQTAISTGFDDGAALQFTVRRKEAA